MAQPLTQTVFQPTDFDLFLDEVGLQDVTGKARLALVDKLRDSVHYSIVSKIAKHLDFEGQITFVNLMKEADKTGNEAPVNEFLFQKIPHIESLIEESIEEVKDKLRFSSANLQDLVDQEVAFLEHARSAGTKHEVNEQFNPPDTFAPYTATQPTTVPIPEPIDEGQIALTPTADPLAEARQILHDSPLSQPMSDREVVERDLKDDDSPTLQSPIIPPPGGADTVSDTDSPSGSTNQGMNEELNSLQGGKFPWEE